MEPSALASRPPGVGSIKDLHFGQWLACPRKLVPDVTIAKPSPPRWLVSPRAPELFEHVWRQAGDSREGLIPSSAVVYPLILRRVTSPKSSGARGAQVSYKLAE
ncbi:hypothetical protein EMPG_11912 [Blastomyces silverae]|uniref:Uncharacterized protein n=1 Tax=Blastomyces silverae TaxID=2060906 RepID=A0A0H1BNL3_9EURO|nr:hypothetical protein EMPG_11912 [Blastomyces silverae]